MVSITAEPLPPVLYFTVDGGGTYTFGPVTGIQNEDIVSYNGSEFEMVFDGSDVGFHGSVNGIHMLDETTILFTSRAATAIPDVGSIDDADIGQVNATTLGDTTAGTFELYFDGSDVELDTSDNTERIDALAVLDDNRILISTHGNPTVSGASDVRDEDVLVFTPTSLGNDTAGTWAMYFDSSDVEITASDEGINGIHVIDDTIYLTTRVAMAIPGLSAADEDIVTCDLQSEGDTTACGFDTNLYFEGSPLGLGANNLAGISLLVPPTQQDQAITGLTLTDDDPKNVGQATNFTAAIIAGSNVVYSWNFGDGSPVITQGPISSHTYTAANDYTVTVTATNGINSLSDSTIVTIEDVPQPPPANELVGNWSLDEASGNRADASNSNNALVDNNNVGSISGQFGLAADFERDNNEYLSISDANQTGLNITGDLTLAGWIRIESTPNDAYSVILSKYDYGSNNRAYRFALNSDRELSFIVSPDGAYSSAYNLIGNTALSINRWYHVAAVFDADQQTSTVYLDGQVDGTTNVGHTQIFGLSTAPFILGADLDGGTVGQHFDGRLDEWKVYAKALTGTEIEALAEPPQVVAGSCNPTFGSGGFAPGIYETTVAGTDAVVVVGDNYDPANPTYLTFHLHGDGAGINPDNGVLSSFQNNSNAVTDFVKDNNLIFVAPEAPNDDNIWWKNFASGNESEHINKFADVLDEMFANYNVCRDIVFGSSGSGGGVFWAGQFFPDKGDEYPAHTVLSCGSSVANTPDETKVDALGQDQTTVARSSFFHYYGALDTLVPPSTIEGNIAMYQDAGFTVDSVRLANGGHCNEWSGQGLPTQTQRIVEKWGEYLTTFGTPTVNPTPTASFSSSSPDELGQVTSFTNTSTGSGLTYQWDFGDGSPIVTDANPTHTYSAAGSYTVILTVTNSDGSDTFNRSVIIIESAIDYSDFTNTGAFTFNGDAAPATNGGLNVLRVTPSLASQEGSVFLSTPINFSANTSFETQFSYRIHANHAGQKADGFYFVLQNDPAGATALGAGGASMGYQGSTVTPVTDPIVNSVGVGLKTWESNAILLAADDGSTVSQVDWTTASSTIGNDNIQYVWIDYDGSTDLLEIYLADSNIKPATPNLATTIDIHQRVGSQAYLGFTAGTGVGYSYHDIHSWQFTSDTTSTTAPD
ncbi:MAG: PKD domain-containing protein, partial [Chloroflexota bacterium]